MSDDVIASKHVNPKAENIGLSHLVAFLRLLFCVCLSAYTHKHTHAPVIISVLAGLLWGLIGSRIYHFLTSPLSSSVSRSEEMATRETLRSPPPPWLPFISSDTLLKFLPHSSSLCFFFPFSFFLLCPKGPDSFKNYLTFILTFCLHRKTGQRRCTFFIIHFFSSFLFRAAGNCTTHCSTVKIW